LTWFEDNPRAHYSIHNIAKYGMIFEKNPGSWFGPSTIGNVLKYDATVFVLSIVPVSSDTNQ
jgi:hypothetical protein